MLKIFALVIFLKVIFTKAVVTASRLQFVLVLACVKNKAKQKQKICTVRESKRTTTQVNHKAKLDKKGTITNT